MQICVTNWLFVILPSPIPELQHALLPLKCCKSVNAPQLLILPLFSILDSQLGPYRVWGCIIMCSVAKMSLTLTFWSINWLKLGTILVMVKNSYKLAMAIEITWNDMKASTSMSLMNLTLNPSKF